MVIYILIDYKIYMLKDILIDLLIDNAIDIFKRKFDDIWLYILIGTFRDILVVF